MGIETAIVASAVVSGISSYRTQRANKKLAKQQLAAAEETAADAAEAEATALEEKKQALARQRAKIGVALGEGTSTSTGAGIKGYLSASNTLG